jgi:hypothetical protein
LSSAAEIAKIRDDVCSSPPRNEAGVNHRVVYPILYSVCGYAHSEIEPESPTPHNIKPDFTLLPDSVDEWYIESKTWKAPLDAHALQALTYPLSKGKRWVVLTNGMDWQLLDLHTNGSMQDRLVASVSLSDPGHAELFFDAIAKQSVTSGGLSVYAERSRLRRLISVELADPTSGLVGLITGYCAKRPGLLNVSGKSVVEQLAQQVPIDAEDRSDKTTQQTARRTNAKPKSAPVRPAGIVELPLPVVLNELSNHVNRKPLAVTIDDSQHKVDSWAALCGAVLAHVGQSKALTVPRKQGLRGKTLVLGHEPRHEDGSKFRSFVAIDTPTGKVYLNSHSNTTTKLLWLVSILRDIGVDPGSVAITMA